MGNQSLADFALKHALSLGATYAEARWERTSANAFSFKNGIPQLGGFGEVEGLGIKLIFHGAIEYCSTDWMDKAHVKKLVEDGLRNASGAARLVKERVMSSTERAVKAKWEVKQKKKIANVDVGEKFEILKGVENALAESEAKVPSRFLMLGDSLTDRYFTSSDGSRITSVIPRVYFAAIMTVQHGGNSMQRHLQFDETGGYERLYGWNLEQRTATEAEAIGKVLAEGVAGPKGDVDLVCAPEVMGIASHESVGHPYEADRIYGREGAQAGDSFLSANDIGRRIGSEVPTVVDDPTLPNSAGYFRYDDEGIAARRKTLMVNGVVAEFLLNRESAYRMGLNSNGSARAMDYESEPIVRMSNTYLMPGDHTEEELIEGVKNGVYVKSFTEWNIDDKRMNQKYVSCEAYLIENGELGKPVKRAVIESTTPGFWSAVDAVAKNVDYFAGSCGKGEPMQGVPVWMGGPSARLRNMRLGV